ncbi:hypothetical protein [Lacisediminihabitans sp.]|uniref:hypothetical protein n=1 Tax=Lacisediminihabitans sp. TaxID=2787631 RepID=UPI002F92F605
MTLAVGLAGCAAGGGQTAAAATRQVKAIPGSAASTYVASDSSYSGFTKENGTTVQLTVEPGFQIPDPGKLVDFLIRLGWSVNDNKPNSELFVVIDSAAPIDATAAAKGAGWKSASSLPDDSTGVFIDLKEVEKRLGGWPGKVPAMPAGVVVKDPVSPDPSTR